MAEEKPKGKSLKLKESGDAAVRKPSAETPERREKDSSKEAPKSGTKDSVSSFGKNLVKVGKEFAKSNGREQDGKGGSREGKGAVKVEVKEEVKSPVKVVSKGGKVAVKQEGRAVVKDEAKSPVKVASKGGKVSVKEKGNGKEQGKSVGKDAGKVNGKEQGKSGGKVNGKDSGGVRDPVKAKEEGRDRGGEKENGMSSNVNVKGSPASTPVKPGSATKVSPKSTKAGASLNLVKKKIVKTEITVTTKIVGDQKKEKKAYSLPGQKHDPPEERDALRIFYSTLREQKPESEMAEIWLMEHGLLPHDEAEKAFERKQKLRGQSVKSGTVTKSSTPSRASNGSPAVKKSTPVSNGKGKGKAVGSSSKGKKKRDELESDSDEDFLDKPVTKKKLKVETDSDDELLQNAVIKKKLKK